MSSFTYTIIMVAIAAGVTLMLRAIPFIIFNGGRQMPPFVKRISDSLPPAIMAVLVVYCVKDYLVSPGMNSIAAAVAIAAVVAVHLLKKNTLLSIAVGTMIYMVIIRIM